MRIERTRTRRGPEPAGVEFEPETFGFRPGARFRVEEIAEHDGTPRAKLERVGGLAPGGIFSMWARAWGPLELFDEIVVPAGPDALRQEVATGGMGPAEMLGLAYGTAMNVLEWRGKDQSTPDWTSEDVQRAARDLAWAMTLVTRAGFQALGVPEPPHSADIPLVAPNIAAAHVRLERERWTWGASSLVAAADQLRAARGRLGEALKARLSSRERERVLGADRDLHNALDAEEIDRATKSDRERAAGLRRFAESARALLLQGVGDAGAAPGVREAVAHIGRAIDETGRVEAAPADLDAVKIEDKAFTMEWWRFRGGKPIEPPQRITVEADSEETAVAAVKARFAWEGADEVRVMGVQPVRIAARR